MKQLPKNYKRIVIKIGSSLFYTDRNRLDSGFIKDIAGQIACLVKNKQEVVIVSSGAIGLGMSMLGLKMRPKELSYLQATAAVGQSELMDIYRRHFKQEQLNCAQVLLTWEDFDDRRRYLNARNTLFKLLELGAVPVINENDTVSTDEIKFGDNDRLSAMVASLIGANILIILSDVDGLLDKDRKICRLIPEITQEIKALALPTDRTTSVGGMITKIEAAKISVDSGIPCVIANGRSKNIILSVVSDKREQGTLFIPKTRYLAAKKSWIAFGAKPKGHIIVDQGAKIALLNKKSLLSVGVTGTRGSFEAGDIVGIMDCAGCEFARGKARLAVRQLDKIKGARSDKEVIHSHDIVIL